MKTLFGWASGLLSAAFLYLACNAYLARRALENLCASDRLKIVSLQSAMAAEEKKAERVRASLATAMPPNTPPTGVTPARNPGVSFWELRKNNPALQNAFFGAYQGTTARTFGVLFQQLGLNSEQRAKFAEIVTNHLAAIQDISAVGEMDGQGADDPVFAELKRQADQKRDSDLASLLGKSGYQAMQVYIRAIPARVAVEGLAREVAFSAPLGSVQAEQLTQAIAAASPDFAAGGRVNPAEVDWAAVDRQARTVLTPRQFEKWTQTAARQEALIQGALKQAKADDPAGP